MMEFMSGVGAFIAGFLFTWPALLALFFFGVMFEYWNRRGLAVFIGIVAAVSAYFYFDIPLLTIAYYSAGYFAIGLVWSFWRYKRYVEVAVNDYNKNPFGGRGSSSPGYKESLIESLKPSNQWQTIMAWIFIWPFSAVENLTADLIRVIEMVVKKFFRGVYNRIYEAAVAALR
jgi:hypothetical protein